MRENGLSQPWNSRENGQIRLVVDFRRINYQLVRTKFPLPTIEEILTSIAGFKYATCIDLNMGYLSIPLDKKARDILVIVLPFEFFECQIYDGLKPASDLF